MKLYLAGPMRGIADFNFPAFHEGARLLRAAGYTVFSPAEKDLDRVGDIFTGLKGTDEELVERNFSVAEALMVDFGIIAYEADGIALLDGWERSKGVKAETAFAEALNKPVHPVATYLERVKLWN